MTAKSPYRPFMEKAIGYTVFKLKLFGKINLCIAVFITAFYWLLTEVNNAAETQFSYIAEEHIEQLEEFATQANTIVNSGDREKLQHWKDQLSQKEDTLVAVIHVDIKDTVATEWDSTPYDGGHFGRPIQYPIHLYHSENPLMDIPLATKGYHLLIRLPQRMRPGAFWNELYFISRTFLPIIFAMLVSYVLYRYLLSPIQKLERATRRYAEGDFSTKIYPKVAHRQDEISALAYSFDDMGEKVSAAIAQQRQLIQDISHELRTPLARIQLSLDSHQRDEVIARVEAEVQVMKKLVEGALTLAWLENEKPTLNKDTVDLAPLIESIVEDARFEFPTHSIIYHLNTVDPLKNSSHLALSQSIENIIRNACKYTPSDEQIEVRLRQNNEQLVIEIEDQGPGIPDSQLDNIFKPFFRLEESRNRSQGGFGLGLALCKRQIEACGGTLSAQNRMPNGLKMKISLPKCKKRKSLSQAN